MSQKALFSRNAILKVAGLGRWSLASVLRVTSAGPAGKPSNAIRAAATYGAQWAIRVDIGPLDSGRYPQQEFWGHVLVSPLESNARRDLGVNAFLDHFSQPKVDDLSASTLVD
ncbi:hypothetical protein FRC00_009765 [Tulasnella sp. 408]|nr:hypothetical protein FRC00_009765 [Tulasnella sp. 408]